MITIIQQTPELAPVYNDLVMTVVSDKVISKYKFKYVFDIFAYNTQNQVENTNNDTYLGRVRVTPNPTGFGMLDLARYLQNKVNNNVATSDAGQPYIIQPNTGSTNSQYNVYILGNAITQYYVVVGEEYSDTIDGQVVLYNGNDTVATGTVLTSLTGSTCYGFDGVKQYDEGLTWDVTDYVLPTGRTLLTNSPRTLYKETDEFITIAQLYGTYSGSTTGTSFNGGTVRADVYNSSNTLLTSFPSNSAPRNFAVATSAIRIENGGVNIATIVAGYENTWNKIVVRFGYNTAYSESLTIYRKNCPWDKYDPVDVLWVNRLGGWDNFRFYGQKNENIKISRTTYMRQYGTWSQTQYTYDTAERGNKNIKTDLVLDGEITSDFLERDTVNWLEELLTSPQVYIIESATKLKPINITDSSFTRQLRGNTKLRQVSFRYQYSELIRTQQK